MLLDIKTWSTLVFFIYTTSMSLCVYPSTHLHMLVYIYVYTSIHPYTERERERDKSRRKRGETRDEGFDSTLEVVVVQVQTLLCLLS